MNRFITIGASLTLKEEKDEKEENMKEKRYGISTTATARRILYSLFNYYALLSCSGPQ